jgi:hypothetical protein
MTVDGTPKGAKGSDLRDQRVRAVLTPRKTSAAPAPTNNTSPAALRTSPSTGESKKP